MTPHKPHRKQTPRGPAHANKVRPGHAETTILNIEKPIYGGNFLARSEGKAVFVPLTLPGEQARVRMVEEKRGYASAEIDELMTAAPERVSPGCLHFGLCGGCQYQHAGYETQLQWKLAVLRETLERSGVTPLAEIGVIAGQPWAYRNRIRLAFDEAGRPGYRGRRSHSVVPIAECPIAAPLLVEAALASAEIVRSLAPLLRPAEIALFCDPNEAAMLASVFAPNPSNAGFDAFARALQERIPALAGVQLLFENNRNERVQPPRIIAQWGANSLAYRAAGFDYRVDHGAFFQVNRWLVDPLVARVTAARKGALAWDLFAGVGLFARKLTAGFERVVAVESAPAATQALAANLKGTTGSTMRANTLDFLGRNRTGERPELIVADPPRTGLGADITALLAELSPPEMVYVSCDPATLARDLRALLATGYEIDSMVLADLFPQTFHLETVVQLRRS